MAEIPAVPDDYLDAEWVRRVWAEMQTSGIKNPSRLAKRISADREVEVHRGTPAEWLRGESDLPLWALAAFADAFDCSMDYLWGRTDDRTGFFTPDAVDDALTEIERAVADARRRAQGPRR